MPIRTLTIVAAFAASLLSAQVAVAKDADAGAKLYKKQCRGCHGPTAKGLASYPKLAGQPFDYLVLRLEQYRAGERLGPNTPLMAPRARKLSDEDIANISTWIVERSK
ncbi:MAG: cytochrome c [Pseudomonadota bacterium]